MPKARKPAAPPAPPQVGDKVKPANSDMVYEILQILGDGDEVNLHVPGTNLQRFRVRTETLTFVERKPPVKTSNPFTTPEDTVDARDILEHIETVQTENLKRLDDDMDVLKAYLKAQHAPEGVISALEELTVEQHVRWKKAIKKLEQQLEQ